MDGRTHNPHLAFDHIPDTTRLKERKKQPSEEEQGIRSKEKKIQKKSLPQPIGDSTPNQKEDTEEKDSG